MTVIAIHCIANGRLLERWAQIDLIGLMQRLGVMTAIAQDGREAAHAGDKADDAVQRV